MITKTAVLESHHDMVYRARCILDDGTEFYLDADHTNLNSNGAIFLSWTFFWNATGQPCRSDNLIPENVQKYLTYMLLRRME